MSKRASGPPRRPRNPVAKAVRTTQYRMRVVPDKRGRPVKPPVQELEELLEESSAEGEKEKRPDADAERKGEG